AAVPVLLQPVFYNVRSTSFVPNLFLVALGLAHSQTCCSPPRKQQCDQDNQHSVPHLRTTHTALIHEVSLTYIWCSVRFLLLSRRPKCNVNDVACRPPSHYCIVYVCTRLQQRCSTGHGQRFSQ
ncbi:unnamed protein product, partial [Pylaiella littoralis]